MDITTYLKMRRLREAHQWQPRKVCLICLRSGEHCYCKTIEAFDPKIRFAILIHHLEDRRPIATGRMAHLCLQNSELILGQDYSSHVRVNELINDEEYYSVILYPGKTSKNLTLLSQEGRASLIPSGKKLLVFVIDGTWNTAKKMARSKNLSDLPRICFTPPGPSNFRVRKQPKAHCYSTLEAIHQTIDLLGDRMGFDTHSRQHDNLLHSFNWMVEKQLGYLLRGNPRHTRDEKKPRAV